MQAEEDESEERITPEDLCAIVVDGIRRYDSQLFANLGVTISITGLHMKHNDLEEARILVHGLALKVRKWRPPWFRYRRRVVMAYRMALQTYRMMFMRYFMSEIFDNASQELMESGDG